MAAQNLNEKYSFESIYAAAVTAMLKDKVVAVTVFEVWATNSCCS
jgi:hypothetical protein